MVKKVLVIDDDPSVRLAFTRALERVGYKVDAAPSGKAGIELQKEARYDLIFLDLRMPGLDGVEVLRELRKIDRKVPVYIITAFHQEFLQELKLAKKDGLDFEIIHKPVEGQYIIRLAKGIFEGATQY